MPPPGRALVGRVGGDCQQLLGGKLVYCQKPGAEIKTSLVSRSHPRGCRQRLLQILHRTAGVPRIPSQG